MTMVKFSICMGFVGENGVLEKRGLHLMLKKMMGMIEIRTLWNCLLLIDSSIEEKCKDNKTSIDSSPKCVEKKAIGTF